MQQNTEDWLVFLKAITIPPPKYTYQFFYVFFFFFSVFVNVAIDNFLFDRSNFKVALIMCATNYKHFVMKNIEFVVRVQLF